MKFLDESMLMPFILYMKAYKMKGGFSKSVNNEENRRQKELSYFQKITNPEYIKSLPVWKQHSLAVQSRLPKLNHKHLQFKGKKNKTEVYETFYLGSWSFFIRSF